MDAREFIELLENPEKVSHKSVEELKNLSLEYPYSQPVQLLYTIRLSQSSEYLFSRQLGKTSVLTDDRSVLFDRFERESDELVHTEEHTPSDKELLEADLQEKLERKEGEAQEQVPGATRESKDVSRQSQKPGEVTRSAEQQPEEPISLPADEPRKNQGEEDDAAAVENTFPSKEPSETSGKPEPENSHAELSAKDRIKAILEKNRKLREEHEKKKKKDAEAKPSEFESRIAGIRQKMDSFKKKEAKTDPAQEPELDSAENAKLESPPANPDQSSGIQKSGEGPGSVDQAEDFPKNSGKLPNEDKGQSEPLAPEEEAMVEQHSSEEVEPAMVDEVSMDEEQSEPVFSIDEENAEEPVVEDPDEDPAPLVQRDLHESETEEHSFTEWLKRLQQNKNETLDSSGPEERPQRVPEDGSSFDTKIQLLDSFVEKLPDLKKKHKSAPKAERPDIEMRGLSDEETSLVTETLARVYVKQKHFDKATKAYEILRLKYPEKSSFFAARISEIKKLINSK